MSNLLANKRPGFVLSLLGVVLALVSLIPFSSSAFKVTETYIAMVAAAVIEVLLVILSSKSNELWNLAAPINAVVVLVGMLLCVNPHLDAIGYVVSGLYLIDEIVPFIAFEVIAGIGWILLLAAGFLGIVKDEA